MKSSRKESSVQKSTTFPGRENRSAPLQPNKGKKEVVWSKPVVPTNRQALTSITKGVMNNSQNSQSLKNKNDCVAESETTTISMKPNFKNVPTGNSLNPETDLVVKRANSMPANSQKPSIKTQRSTK